MKTNKSYIFSLIFAALTVLSGNVLADPTVIYSENFGSTSSNTALASYSGYSATTAMFSTSGDVKTHYTGSGSVGKNNLSAANLSNGYTGASGLSGCYHGGTANTAATIIQISNIKISGYSNLHLSFGALGGSTSHKVNVTYKIDNGSETTLINNGSITNANWTLIEADIPGTGSSLTIYIKHTPTKAWTIRLDDIKVTGTASTPTPSLTCATTSLSFSAAKDGSSEKKFTFSGANLKANAGLAISGTNSGMFSVSPNNVSKGSGTITDQEVTVTYSPTAAGNHSATLTISSTDATSKTITLTGSATSVTANPQSITFDTNSLDGEDEVVGSSTITSIAVTNGTKSSGNYLNVWVESDQEDDCLFSINNDFVYTSGNSTSISNLSVEYLATTTGTFTGNVIAQGYNSSYEAVNCTIPLSVTITAGCEKAVAIAKGTETNASLTLGETSVKTCSSTASDRQVTVSVAPNSCYAAPVAASVSSIGVAATQVSGPTWNSTTEKYDYVYQFAQNATGTTTFAVNLSTKTTYTINYNKGTYGTGDNSSDTKTCGVDLTLPGVSFTRTGYTQQGWSTAQAGTSKAYYLQEDYTANAATTLYPYWEANPYNIIYKDKGDVAYSGENTAGLPTGCSAKHTYNVATALANGVKTGYTFDGWFTDADCTESAGSSIAANTISTDITLYAKWTVNTYDVAFDANGGSGTTMTNQDFTWGVKQNLSANTYTAPLHKFFYGWNTNKTEADAGTREFQPGQEVQNLTDENGATVTLYAVWANHTFTNYRTLCCTQYDITLTNSGTATGGTFAAEQEAACESNEVELTATPTTGYEFASWSAKYVDGTEKDAMLDDANANPATLTMPAFEVTINASFNAKTYSVTLNKNNDDATGSANGTVTATYNSATLTSLSDATRTSGTWELLGYYTASSDGDKVIDADGNLVADVENYTDGDGKWIYDDDAVLYAQWIYAGTKRVTISDYSGGTVTVTDGGSISFTSGYQDVDENTVLTITATPVAGYSLTSLTVRGNTFVSGNTHTVTADVTIAAVFTAITYNISYEGVTGATHSNPATYTIPASAITLSDASKTGYNFEGWTEGGTPVTAIAAGATGDKTFTANWTAKTMTVTLNNQDATTVGQDEVTGTYNAGLPSIAENLPAKTGYTFQGYFENTNGGGTKYYNADGTANANWNKESATTIYAYWTKNKHNVYFRNNGQAIDGDAYATREVYYGEAIGTLPTYDANKFTSCDATSTTFKGWCATPITIKQASAPTYATAATLMGDEDIYLHAVFAAEKAGGDIPVSVFATTSLGSTNTVTSGYNVTAEAEAKTGYYQDGSGTKRYVDVRKSNTSTAMIGVTPKSVTVTATLGGGTAKDPLSNNVYAVWLNSSGAELGDPVLLTTKITDAGGSDFTASLPVANATSAYGVRVYHNKETSYNVRYVNISLSYTISNITYDDYVTSCCTLTAVDNVTAVDNTSDTQVTLNWTALSSANQEGVSKLQVVDANNVVKVDNLAASANTATVTGLTQCETYSFRVATVGASCTTYSDAVEARPFGSAKVVTFDNDFEGGAVTEETTTCDESSVALATPDTRSGYRFLGWFNGDNEVTDDPYTPTTSVTLKAHWAQEYTLHYEYDGAAGAPADAKYIAGETVTLPENPTKNFMSPFQEWSYSTSVTMVDETHFQMPASNLTVTAVFGGLQGQWFLVTDVNELQATDMVIIAAKDYNYAMSTTQNTNNRGRTSITKKGNVLYAPSDAVQIFEIEAGTANGSWAFRTLNGTADKYIYAAGSSNNNYLKSEDAKSANSSFILDIAVGKATAQGTSTNKVMQYNAGNSIFSCYGSASQEAIAFYRFVEGTFYEVTVPEAASVTGGTITSDQTFVAAGETVTLTYTPKRGYTVGTLTVTGVSGSVTISPTVTAGTTEYTFTMPAEAVTVAATFVALPPVVYHLLENVNDIVIGQQFVFVGTKADGSEPYVAGEIDGGRLIGDDVMDGALNTTDKTLSLTAENAVDYVLDGEPGAYKISYNNTYLKHGNSSGSVSWDATGSAWTIAISDGKATVVSGDYTFQYNVTSHWFTAYTSASQQPVYIYTLPATTYSLTLSGCKTLTVAEGYEYTIKNSDVPSSTPGATYEFLHKWTDGTNTYAVGDAVTVNADVTLQPCWKVTPTANTDINTLPTNVTEIVVLDGKTLAIGADRSLDNLTVEAGGKVSGSEALTVNNFVIEASQVDGKSGQVTGAGALNVTGEAYFDLKVAEAGRVTAGWYTFAVPFPVDALNGVYYGDTKLTNEVNYAIMAYDGDVRAQGKYGWKKYRGTLKPGTMYTITLGNTDYNVLRFRKASGSVVAENKVALHKYPLKGGNTGDNGWNAVANPNLYYSKCAMTKANKIQFYNHNENKFIGDDATGYTYIVGSCFFVQVSGGEDVTMVYDNDPGTLKAPQREAVATEEFKVRLGKTTEDYVDQLFVSASEDATDTYQTGHDLRKCTIDSKGAKVAQMTVNGYGMSLCDAEFPLVNNTAIFPLTLTSPKAEAYTLYIARQPENATLYLMQNGSIIWNLTTSPFVIDLPQGSETSYSLMIVNAAQTPTDVQAVTGDGLQVTGVQKIILNEHVYILRDGKMYDAAGAVVR